MSTDFQPPNKPGVCQVCDEPSMHLQEAYCWNDGCQLPTGLLCESCYRHAEDGREPNLCEDCAKAERRRERAYEREMDIRVSAAVEADQERRHGWRR